MENEIINPDAAILAQSEGMWQKYVAILIHKFGGATVTNAEIEAYSNDPKNILLTHGHHDSIEFRMVDREEAERLAKHNSSMGSQKVN